jgi:hypothetical protein
MIDLAIALILQLGILCALARRLPNAVGPGADTRRSVDPGQASPLRWDAARQMIERSYGCDDVGMAGAAPEEIDA